MKILIIEDEVELSQSIVTYLKTENYICEVAQDLNAAFSKTDMFEYDCILLDLSLPGGDGLQVLRELKENNKSDGVIIISAKNSIDDRILGLNMGADDYLSKPFHLSELSARIAAIIRRKKFSGNSAITFNEITIDTHARQVLVNNKSLDLTRKEYQLLLYFVINKGRVISKNAIAEHLWGDNMDFADSFDFIYTHIKNLRKKMNESGAQDYIRAIYGMGYKFNAE